MKPRVLMIAGIIVAALTIGAQPSLDATGKYLYDDTETEKFINDDARGPDNLSQMFRLSRAGPGNYSEPLNWMRQAAERGDAEAQYYLGLSYERGYGISKNDAEAMKWYREAAEQGLAEAQYNLSAMYIRGSGGVRDYAAAVKWLRLAAGQGLIQAQNNLALMYVDGHGVKQSYILATTWFHLAAEEGFAEAQFNVAFMYYNGLGVAQDFATAYNWLHLAAIHGHKKGYSIRDELAKRMTLIQIEDARWQTSVWIEVHPIRY